MFLRVRACVLACACLCLCVCVCAGACVCAPVLRFAVLVWAGVGVRKRAFVWRRLPLELRLGPAPQDAPLPPRSRPTLPREHARNCGVRACVRARARARAYVCVFVCACACVSVSVCV